MDGSSGLACRGFIETDSWTRSRQDVPLSDQEMDERVGALLWQLMRDPSGAVRVPGRNLWTAVTVRPRLRIYLRPRADVPDECELLWVEQAV